MMRLRRGAGVVPVAALMAAEVPPSVFALTWRGHADTEDDHTTYTFTDCAIGSASDDRIVSVAIAMGAASNTKIASVTIGGVSATPRVVEQYTDGRISECWDAVVPSGSTADIVVTHSVGSNSRISVDWWTITGGQYAGRSGQYPNILTSATVITSTAVTVPAGGGAVVLCRVGATSGANVTWGQTSGSGTPRTDEPGGTTGLWVATYDTLAGGSQQFTATKAGTAAQMRILAVAYEPAP